MILKILISIVLVVFILACLRWSVSEKTYFRLPRPRDPEDNLSAQERSRRQAMINVYEERREKRQQLLQKTMLLLAFIGFVGLILIAAYVAQQVMKGG